MKLLAFSDVHEDYVLLKKLVKRAQQKDIDLVICAGDFTVMGSGMRRVLSQLDSIGKKVLVIPGNHESPEKLAEFVGQTTNCFFLHKNHYSFQNILFVGYGTDGFSLEDPEFRQVAREWRREFPEAKLVLVTHGPAHGTKLDWLVNRHVGNKDYRKFIERVQPLLAISGHLHETIGLTDTIGTTTLVNPCWEGMVIELG